MNIAGLNNNEISNDDELFDDSVLAAFNTSEVKESSSSKRQDTVLNRSIDLDASLLNVSALCCDEEFSGYDKLSGRKWMYPINYPVRDYQYNIINAAILKNTLVSLPTGLGKTFIAAVLMYNFYRWYPMGKIVFTAPTRPLIAQQIEACYNIIAMPPDDTIEMTGNMNATLRKEKWETKRVFFATPQVVSNDIKSGICPGKKIRCLVIDEAHKAKSNYAYCHIVSMLTDMQHRTYRILALSATPGSRINDVVQVVKNLQIAHLELRTENCIDVAKYCYSRNIKTVVIPLGLELSRLRQEYIEVLDFYARKLKQMNILKSNSGNLSKGRILMIYKDYQTNNIRHPQRSYIMKDLSQLISLYHGLELLVSHGARSFLNFFDEHPEKMWIQSDDRLTVLLERLRDDLGVNPLNLNTNVLPDGTIPEIPKNLTFGHPKFDKVKEIMLDHFQKAKDNNEDTRAIVFCEYHETVKLVHCLLLQCRPLINARTFVGQGAPGKGGRAAMSQKEQLLAMRRFRAGGCNALVATCVAEEGLDVGAVDLIVCFDVATRSPVRLVQRCGRTGRERSGQVYFLVTEGKEHQTLLDGMRQRDSLKAKILHSKEVQENLYKLNPRMLPYDVTPKCEQIYVTVKKQDPKGSRRSLQENQEKSKKKQNEDQLGQDTIPTSTTTSNNTDINKNIPVSTNSPNNEPAISQNKQSTLITAFLSPKKDSKETRVSTKPSKLNAVSSQSGKNKKQKVKSKMATNSTNNKNYDIRALLLPTKKPNQSSVKLFNRILDENKGMSTQFLDLFIHLKTESEDTTKCYICENNSDICKDMQKLRKKQRNNNTEMLRMEGAFLDLKLIDEIDADSIRNYTEDLEKNQKENALREEKKKYVFYNDFNIPKSQNVNYTCVGEASQVMYDLHNFGIGNEDIISSQENKNKSVLQNDAPISERQNDDANETNVYGNARVLHNLHNFDIGDPEDITLQEENENDLDLQNNKTQQNVNANNCVEDVSRELSFYIGDVDDIFAVSPQREEETKGTETKYEDVVEPLWASSNFDLGSIDDILEINAKDEHKNDLRSTDLKEENKNILHEIPIVDSNCAGSEKPDKDLKRVLDRQSPILNNEDLLNGDIPTIDLTHNYDGSQECEKDCKKDDIKSPIGSNGHLLCSDIPTIDLSCDGSQENEKDTQEKFDTKSPILSKINRDLVSDIIDLSLLEEHGHKKDCHPQQVQSPSLLSGTRDPVLKSPILTTHAQKRKLKINLKLKHNSTPNSSSAKRRLNLQLKDIESEAPDADSSMLSVTQTLDLINSDNVSHSPSQIITIPDEHQSRVSPILLTQAERNKEICGTDMNRSVTKRPDENVLENIRFLQTFIKPQLNNKRKVDDEIFASPFFNKKQKLDHQKEQDDCDTIQKKVFAALTNHNITGPKLSVNNKSLKENRQVEAAKTSNLADKYSYTPIKSQDVEKTTWSKTKMNKKKSRDLKKKKISDFIDLEASLSGDESGSGDELTDDSMGSIIDFITDKDATHTDEDMQAHYLKSVRSPLKNGAFKIPQITKSFKNNVFSQFSQQDSYEMDSFCVDSHVELTQDKDLSAIEIVEMMLEEKRKRRKKSRIKESSSHVNGRSVINPLTIHEDGDSPIIKRRNKARNIIIDSDDSS